MFEWWEHFGFDHNDTLHKRMAWFNDEQQQQETTSFIALPQTYVENVFKNMDIIGEKG